MRGRASRDPVEIRARLAGPCNSTPTIFTRDGEIDHDGMRAMPLPVLRPHVWRRGYPQHLA